MSDLLGRVAHFRLLDKLGQGGMGVVYRAEDEKLLRIVALKVLPPETVGDDTARRRLLREARAAAAVVHASICVVFEVGEDAGRIYVAMELVEGMTLRERLRKQGAFQCEEALRIAHDITRGLARAHEKGIVHRDLKPDNVMIDSSGGVKILDFGLAKGREDEAKSTPDDETLSRLTKEGDIVGTPAYMAPEQFTGTALPDKRGDVYSLGVLLYELLTNIRPFRGPTAGELMAAILRDQPEPPSKYVPLPPEVDALVLRCLRKTPAERFDSARELQAAIEALTEVGTKSTVTKGALSKPAELIEQPRPKSATRVLAGTAIALVALVGAVYALRPPDALPPDVLPPIASKDGGVGLLDLPAPQCNPAAQLEYRAGVRTMHELGWRTAEPRFHAATKADPECAEAHLRCAMIALINNGADARESFQRAISLRARLGAREQALMDAYEPRMAREPPDFKESDKRVVSLAERFPNDAELLLHGAALSLSSDPARSIPLARQATVIDPGFADAWQILALSAARTGELGTAKQSLDQCMINAPVSIDCAQERLLLDRRLGECSAMEKHARAVTTKNPSSLWLRTLLATSLASTGSSRELVTEVLQPFWASLPPEREHDRLHQRALVAILYGDFARAREELDALAISVESRVELGPHVAEGLTRLELLLETNDAKAAAQLANGYVRRMSAWTRPPLLGVHVWGIRLFEPRLAVARTDLSPPERDAEIAAWHAWIEKTDTDATALWALGDGMLAESPVAAEKSLARMPPRSAVLIPSAFAAVDGFLGRTLLRGGRVAEAVTALRTAASRCDATEYPFEHTRTHLWLGEALEASGESAACEAYAVVLQRWGAAKPASVTATAARERSTKLACAPK